MESLDVVVIGAGVVGLAIGRRLAMLGRRVVVLEAEAAMGMHASSRNSEVIHAGIYYPPGSLKARLCVEGKRALYAYLGDRGVPHRAIGKVLVAVHENEVAALDRYRTMAEANGVTDLVALDAVAVRSLEPEVVAVRGLLSPSTGIVDSHALMRALKADVQAAGSDVVLSAPVLGGYADDGGVVLEVGGADPIKVRCTTVVNAAGLFATHVARAIRGVAQLGSVRILRARALFRSGAATAVHAPRLPTTLARRSRDTRDPGFRGARTLWARRGMGRERELRLR